MNATLHDQDFYSWTRQQAMLLRAGRLEELDIEHLAEEVETLGRSERRELLNRLALLFGHLLKWQHQADRRSNSWRNTIEIQRLDARRVLKDNPALKGQMPEILRDAYTKARLLAANETGLSREHFPDACPWDIEQTLDDQFWPETF